jgi:hypothetical protein
MVRELPDRRIVLVLGAPRSGTSWLANILNSHPDALYCHETMGKLSVPAAEHLTHQMTRTGKLTPDERRVLLREWVRADPIHRRPPFFPKSFQRAPASLQKWCWGICRRSALGCALFRALFSPSERRPFDLVLKEVGWPVHAPNIVQALDPELIVIIRHPCAVVGSELRGIEKGVMPRKDREEWLRESGPVLAELGFTPEQIRAMPEFEWLAVTWMATNQVYRSIVARHPRSLVLNYEELCRDPLGGTREIFRFLNWQVTPQTRAFLDQSTHAASSWMTMLLGHQPYFGIYRETAESPDKWKTALPPAQRDRVLELVQPFFPEYGGPMNQPSALRPATAGASA